MTNLFPKVTFATVVVTALFFNFSVTEVKAAVREITNFTEIDDAVFIDLPSGNILNPVNIGSNSITATSAFAGQSNFVNGSFAAFPPGTLNDPGSGDGYFSFNDPSNPLFNTSPVTLNFSSPLAAFGVTFYHFSPDRVGQTNFPARLQVFDAANGSGNLLGSIISSGFQNQDGGNPDFIAVWSDTLNIRSAILSGTGSFNGFGVDGYGISLTPFSPPTSVPEPSTLLALAMLGGSFLATRNNIRFVKS